MITRTPEFDLADKVVRLTNKNIFLTGKAGTGKTTFLKALREDCPKRMVVLAPTGVAAINAGGMTIHSFFQLSFGLYLPDGSIKKESVKMRKEKTKLIRTLDLLVIDEISMVRADLLDEVDAALRKIRHTPEPFGGVQLLMIGDPQQLPPVVKNDEWDIMKDYYKTPYFFDSHALNQSGYVCVELKTIFRQADPVFIDLLNKVRDNQVDNETLAQLNEHCRPDFSPAANEGYIRLTTHNKTAQKINTEELSGLKGKTKHFQATVSGNFPESSYPTSLDLELKVGAQVMFIKNDSSPDKKYYNGKIGFVRSFTDKEITVEDKDDHTMTVVEKDRWENIKYTLNPDTGEIEESVEGSFEQIPLRQAWAITIHKSQGLTFDKAIIDAQNSFTHGQVYVALSRCRTLDGMVLSTPLAAHSVKQDARVAAFVSGCADRYPTAQSIVDLERDYYLQLVKELVSMNELYGLMQRIRMVLQNDFSSTYPKLLEKTKEACSVFFQESVSVADKFCLQLENIVRRNEDDYREKVQERLAKGLPYLAEKCKAVIAPILNDASSVETDNKEAQKTLKRTEEQLQSAYQLKIGLLKKFGERFSPEKYLKAKCELILSEKASDDEEKPKKITISEDILHPELLETLKLWRNEKAKEIGMPAYIVLPNKSLIGIANTLPRTEGELKAIPGIGKDKLKKYGNEIIEIIAQHGSGEEECPF